MTMLTQSRAREILELAREAQRNAYAPYSNYHVGACLVGRDADGNEVTFLGCNVENAAYGSTVCAERGSIMAGIVSGCRDFTDIAIVGGTDHWAAPCGSCRQMLVELSPSLNIIMEQGGIIKQMALSELLPMYFTGRELRGE
jgi:cytidine deaminase